MTIAQRLTMTLALAGAAACGSGAITDPSGTAGAANSIAINVAPPSAELQPSGSATFQATVTGTADTAVDWSVLEGAAGGTVTSDGVYTAPALEGTYTLVATAHADHTKWKRVPLVVSVTPVVAVTVVPDSATVTAGDTVSFSASVVGTSNAAVTWSVQESGGGTVATNGVYTAPATAGVYHVVATSAADATKSSTATVTVNPAVPVAVSINPISATVVAGGFITFAATVTNTSNTAVSWSVKESGGGTVANGLYTAPSSTGTYHVVATSVADATKSATATVTVNPDPPPTGVTISPVSASVAAGGTVSFSATVTNATNTAVTWSVQESGGGAVTSAGVYTAPQAAGTFHVVATSVADATKSATAAVTVSAPPPPVAVTITPTSATVAAGGTSTFTATVTNSTNTSVVWSVAEASGGTVTNGLYTAPNAGGTFHVVATSVADATKSATATVTVSAPPPPVAIAINPTSASVVTGGTTAFTATVSNASNTAVAWSVQESGGGTVSSSGLYTAPATAGTYQVVATSVADPTKSAAANVTVTSPPPAVTVSVSPSSTGIGTCATSQFTASVSGSSNTAVTWSVLEGPSGGTVSTSGLYTAPYSAGTFHVVAASQANPAATAEATVSVSSSGSACGSVYALPPDRAVVWQPGVTYNGGIPTRTAIYATISPSGDTSGVKDSAAIQTALNNCPVNGVVLLAPGTFYIGTTLTIANSNITLRGSGAGATVLYQTAGNSAVVVGTLYFSYIQPMYLTADAVQGSNTLTVGGTCLSTGSNQAGSAVACGSPSSLSVGELVNVSEQYDQSLTVYTNSASIGTCTTQTTDSCASAGPQTEGGDYLGKGECSCNHFWYNGDSCWRSTSCEAPAANLNQALLMARPLGQVMEVASVSGNTITFTTKFHMPYRASHKARITRFGWNDLSTPVGLPVRGVGLEAFTVQNGGGGDDAGPLAFTVASHSWMKNIEVENSYAVNVLLKGTFQCEVRDSYIHQTTTPDPGGAGYGYGVDSYSADNLLENNISWGFNKVMVMRDSGGGNVIGYNYMTDGYGRGYATEVEVGINASHATTPQHELFEGNESQNFGSDTTWGNSIYITTLRNHLTGLRIAKAGLVGPFSGASYIVDQSNRRMAEVNLGDLSFSFIGNVLGCSVANTCANASPPDTACLCAEANATMGPSGTQNTTNQTGFVYEPSTPNDSLVSVWQFEYADAYNYGNGTLSFSTTPTILRMGNWDYVNNAQMWPGMGGIGTPNKPPSPLPTIPNSFYTSTKPAFFGSNPWPWVDPTTGKTYVLPARSRFDSGTPNVVP